MSNADANWLLTEASICITPPHRRLDAAGVGVAVAVDVGVDAAVAVDVGVDVDVTAESLAPAPHPATRTGRFPWVPRHSTCAPFAVRVASKSAMGRACIRAEPRITVGPWRRHASARRNRAAVPASAT